MIRVGTAGWQVPRAVRHHFPEAGSTLQRYAGCFGAVEINSTFYRPHQPKTYERWAEATPPGFRFSVKAPKTITHERKLADPGDLLDSFLADARLLGPKLGPILVQLPPSLAFDAQIAAPFFQSLRDRFDGLVAFEPRHITWFEPEPDGLLRDFGVARVAADPPRHPLDQAPGGWPGLAYWRLHGSPRMYYSAYGEAYLRDLAQRLRACKAAETWCMFDNTTSGAAAEDALILRGMLEAGRPA
ncbi:MAG: DUF72 domain-containing protein [Phenylobacterium sp.]